MAEDYLTCKSSDSESNSSDVFFSEENPIVTEQLLFSETALDQLFHDIAQDINNSTSDGESLTFIGIKTRGVPIANRICKIITNLSEKSIEIGSLDINLYRDDLSEVDEQPIIKETKLPFQVSGKNIILFDDVLYTGRTIRAALDALTDFGRPNYIKLAVLIDRGHRELPIHANFVGKAIDTTLNQNVKVYLKDLDGKDSIIIRGD